MSVIDDAERRARMLLSVVAEPGDRDAGQLVARHSAVDLLARLRSTTSSAGQKVAGWQSRLAACDEGQIARMAATIGARYVCPGDDEWPSGFDDLARTETAPGERRSGVPIGIWVRGGGNLDDLAAMSVSIVGSRASTAYGNQVARACAEQCADRGVTVVSGGAYGIDAEGHRGALAADRPTVAILAGGPDQLYPSGNAPLLTTILRDGNVMSEAGPGCAPSRSRFLVRNRLIAAISRGTVVVEAALRSGALNTARWALDLDRPVMGVPGSVFSASSAGVHALIRESDALLVTDGLEIIEHISPIGVGLAPRKSAPTEPLDLLSLLTRQVLDAVPATRPATLESIARVAGLPAADVEHELDTLTGQGFVSRHRHGWAIRPP